MRIAVADLGTNSTRLLVADVEPSATIETVEALTRVTRLGDGVDGSGTLAESARKRVHDCLATYRERADELGAERRIAVATSAVRDASNGRELAAEVRGRHGFDARILSGDDEAALTFLGATAGRAAEPTLVIDIGGGSTEFVIGTPGREPDFAVSTRLGSVRQTERHLREDPPGERELGELRAAAQGIVEDGVPLATRQEVRRAIAVAGTATSLASIDLRLNTYDSARVDGHRLTRDGCERMLADLAAVPLPERERTPGLMPERAPTIVAGAAILAESLARFDLDVVEVREADILHGAAMRELR